VGIPDREVGREVQYLRSVTSTLRLFAAVSVLYKYFPDGTSDTLHEAYADRTGSLTGSVQKDWMSHTVALFVGGSYSRMSGLVDSDAYSADSSLTWKIGKLDLSAGLDAYGTRSHGSLGSAGRYERDHQYVYLRVRRRLF
jgi:hypothetical protein